MEGTHRLSTKTNTLTQNNRGSKRYHDLTPLNTLIPNTVGDLLSLNINFCPSPRKTSIESYEQSFNNLIRSIRLCFMFDDFNKGSVPKNYIPNKSFVPDHAPPIIENTLSNIKSNFLQE